MIEHLAEVLGVKPSSLARDLEKAGGLDALLQGQPAAHDSPLLRRLQALLPLSRELLSREQTLRAERQIMSSPTLVAAWAAPRISCLNHEELWVLCLNQAHALLRAEMLSRGGVTTAFSLPVFLHAVVRSGATGCILVHNHPGGDPTPSKEDITCTREAMAALGHLRIHLHDHIVVAGNAYRSFYEMDLLHGKPTSRKRAK